MIKDTCVSCRHVSKYVIKKEYYLLQNFVVLKYCSKKNHVFTLFLNAQTML